MKEVVKLAHGGNSMCLLWHLDYYIIFNFYRVSKKEWTPVSLYLATTFFLKLLQFTKMSCLSLIYLQNEVQYFSVGQLKLKIHIKMCFQSNPNFYVFVTKSKGFRLHRHSDLIFYLRGSQH